MGTVLASTIISRARTIFNDTTEPYGISDADWLSYLNDTQKAIVLAKPDANVQVAATQLAAGSKQSVTGSIALIKLTRNMGTDGSTPGAPIHYVDWEQFNYIISTAYTATTSATAEVYSYDKDVPSIYYVYPPQPTSSMGYVEEVYAGMPTNLTAITDAISLPDIYETVILNGMLYRATLRQVDEYAMQQAEIYRGVFNQDLGVRNASQDKVHPVRKG